ncbi:MAG: GH3 auxin-responsive promoter family protein [Clostridia bacterium]|nr:GH3 auxin-responsive promoter family protein [Clostridia bacterium]
MPLNDDIEEDETETPKTLLLNELEVGKKYEMVVTNSSGLYRYRMEDIVQVTRMHNNTPVIEFLYRRNLSMNVANEKTTTAMVDFAAKQVFEKTGNEFVGYSFYPDFSTNPPRYCMLTEIKGDISEEKRQEMIEVLDEELKGVNEKYFKYRRWGMLNRPEILILKPDTYWDYRENLRNQGVHLNQIKPVTVINSKPREEFFFSHVLTEKSETLDYIKENQDK